MKWTNVMMAGATIAAVGCGGGSSSDKPDLAPQSLYEKYGGAPTVKKVVDDAVTGLLADCTQAPYFTAVIGKAGHDSVARLKGCLVLQFTAALGGPATYPGKNADGDTCEDMKTIHTGLGIPSDVFDKFIADLGAVLEADGVTATDTATIAGVLTGFKTDIVAATPTVYNACTDAGSP